MILQVLIIISIALQLVAAVVAIRLTRVTKYNISWLLFTLGLVLMCMIRLSEYIYVVGGREWHLPPHFMAWVGVVTSLCFAVGMFYVGKIIHSTRRLNYQRKLTEQPDTHHRAPYRRNGTAQLLQRAARRPRPLLSSARMSLGELAKNCSSKEDAN